MNFKRLYAAALLFLPFLWTAADAREKPYGLLTDLVGSADYADYEPALYPEPEISSERPSFCWIVPGDAPGTRQTSYRIVVNRITDDAADNKKPVWDSGDVKSGNSTGVVFEGPALLPASRYCWQVKVTTNTGGESEWSDPQVFVTSRFLDVYGYSHHPLVKTPEAPISVKRIDPAVVVSDFGKAAFGQITLRLDSETSGRDTVTVHLGEQLKDGRVNRTPGGTVRYARYTIPLKEGEHEYTVKFAPDARNTGAQAVLMPEYIGEVLPFRYCEIENYAGKITSAHLKRSSVHYPFDGSASYFECSDTTLNRIWDMCKYSIKATSFAGIYVDGDRERIPYEADALINQLCHYGVDREYSMARRSHEYLLRHPTWPTEWILQAVLIAWNDYMYTGDSRSLRANYEILKTRTLLSLRTENGLISTTTGLQTDDFKKSIRFNGAIKDIVDWPHTGILGLNKQEGGEADGFVFTDYNTVVNAFHYETLKLMGNIAGALGMEGEAIFFCEEAGRFRDRFIGAFYDHANGRFRDGLDTDHASLHSNMMPMAFGLVPEDEKERVSEFIRSRGMACSVYGAQFLMDALYEAADGDYALRMLTKTDDRGWYNMIRAGSTISLEAWDDKYKPNQDWNHAWGAVPANIIPRKLMGVEPLEPGFGKVRIRPQTSSLEWAKAIVSTVRGAIRVETSRGIGIYRVSVEVPANVDAEIWVPKPAAKPYTIKVNGKKVRVKRNNGSGFLYIGTYPSGKYTVEMTGRV